MAVGLFLWEMLDRHDGWTDGSPTSPTYGAIPSPSVPEVSPPPDGSGVSVGQSLSNTAKVRMG